MTCTQMAGLSDEKVGWDVILGFGNDRSYGHFAADFRAKIGGESEADQVRIMTVDGKVEKDKGQDISPRKKGCCRGTSMYNLHPFPSQMHVPAVDGTDTHDISKWRWSRCSPVAVEPYCIIPTLRHFFLHHIPPVISSSNLSRNNPQ